MRRRPQVNPRRVIFIGVEGKSDRAFVQFLRHCCDVRGLHLHLDVKLGNGGDSMDVVETAGRRLKHHPGRREIRQRMVLLDSDRIEQDQAAGRDAFSCARKWKLEVILQKPNLEGLLVRLHEGQEQGIIDSRSAERRLRQLWPAYAKGSLTADRLKQRFSLIDLQRAAKHDDQLRKLLDVLGL